MDERIEVLAWGTMIFATAYASLTIFRLDINPIEKAMGLFSLVLVGVIWGATSLFISSNVQEASK